MTRRVAPGTSRDDRLRSSVRDRYGQIALSGGCCGSGASAAVGSASATSVGCCGEGAACSPRPSDRSAETKGLPTGADLGLGCGNPTALAELRTGERVLDLGSGAGVDCFLAAKRVGSRGRVVGVDMTPEMVMRARDNARRGRYRNVEFRLGEVEHLPVEDRSIDVVLSNCVINLAPDKGAVYREAFRVLKPGGRLALSDMVATRPISIRERTTPDAWTSCRSGAIEVSRVRELLRAAGFIRVDIRSSAAGVLVEGAAPGSTPDVVSADIRAVRPGGGP